MKMKYLSGFEVTFFFFPARFQSNLMTYKGGKKALNYGVMRDSFNESVHSMTRIDYVYREKI